MTSRPREFFDRAHQAFVDAERECSRDDFLIGNLRLRIESKIGAPLTNALQHLRSPVESAPDLTICAFDGAEMPSPPWRESDYGQRGEIRGFNDAPFRTAFDHTSDALSMIDFERGLALFWTRNGNALPLHQLGAPFRNIMSWFAEQRGMLFVHCGAISNVNGAALLAGAGGSGKSTTALLCVKGGWRYLADDYCMIDPADDPQVFSLYNSAKLTHHSANQFGLDVMLSARHADDGEKDLFFIPEARLAHSARARVLLLPRVTPDRETTVTHASPAEALRAIAPSSMFQLSGAGAVAFERLGQLVRQLPVRRLNLGRDLERIPNRIAECLTSL